MLDFVDHLVEWATGVPILVVAGARPELLARRPGWGGGKANATTLSLAALSDEDTARLIGLLLGRAVLPAETQVELLARAGGNPLYAEQYARMLSERGMDGGLALPETVQGIIAARLDALTAAEKELLQDAAVIGKVFWLGALAAGTRERWEVEQGLHTLERREFVRRQQRSSVAGEHEYAFMHLLVRDVAYGQIPRAQRADKHRLAAEWIESLTPDRSEDRAELLAHHYSSALEYATAAGQDTAVLAERARLALRDAAERSASLFAFADAARHYGAALELWPPDDPERARLQFAYANSRNRSEGGGVELLEDARDRLLAAGDRALAAAAEITLADVRWTAGAQDLSLEHQRRAAELVEGEPTSRPKAFVVAHVSRFLMLASDPEAIIVGRQALAMAEELGFDDLRANALNNIGSARLRTGDRGGIADLEASIALAERVDPLESVRGYGNLASTLAESGDLARHSELYGKALAVAERLGVPDYIRWFRTGQLDRWFWDGRWDEASRLADEFIAETEAGAPFYLDSAWRTVRGRIRLGRGDLSGALEDATKSIELVRGGQDPQLRDPVFIFAASALLEARRDSEANTLVSELDLVNRAEEVLLISAWTIDIPAVYAQLGRGDELAAAAARLETSTAWVEAAQAYIRGDFIEAADTYRRIGSPVDEAHARLRAAAHLDAAGRRSEANVQLQEALAFWRSAGATRYIREGEALLAASA
jgi:hypothetical protein